MCLGTWLTPAWHIHNTSVLWVHTRKGRGAPTIYLSVATAGLVNAGKRFALARVVEVAHGAELRLSSAVGVRLAGC